VAGGDIHALARSVEGMSKAERRGVEERLAQLVPELPGRHLSADDIGAIRSAGVEIGFHTRDHDRLTTLTDQQLREALWTGRSEMGRCAGTPHMALAYPHGAADMRVADAARAAGYEIGYTGRPEAVDQATDPLLLGRIDASSLTVEDLSRHLARALLRCWRR